MVAVLAGCVPWPAELAARYRREGYWTGERLGELLRDVARDEPERVAVVAAGRWSYRELDARADRLAAGLHGLGLRARDRIVVCLPNDVDFITVSIAAFRLGVIPVYALPAHRRSELEYLCRHAEAPALVVAGRDRDADLAAIAAEVASRVPSVRHVLVAGPGSAGAGVALDSVDSEPMELAAPDPQDVAFLLLSGGTTGLPKLIPRTHDDYSYQLRCSAEVVRADAGTIYLAALPVAHNAALGCPGVLGTLKLGGKVVLARSPSPDELFGCVQRERPTLTTAMPALLMLWSELAELFGGDLRGVVVEVGGAMLDPAVAREAQARLGCTLTHWFGMAEGVLCCTRPDDPPEVALTSQGRPLSPADELRVVDAYDREVRDGEVGELLVRGPMTLRGYYLSAEHNRITFTDEGFLRTGDLVRIDASGGLVVCGRIKDVINRGGEKISPGEVEDQLRANPGVRDVALVGLPDRVLGERSCAFVVAAGPGLTLRGVREHLSARGVADYKLPDRLELVPGLPRTRIGKVDRAALRDRALNADHGQPADQALAGQRL
jgi:2,3-dihydroxybenzoate-AMP ligase